MSCFSLDNLDPALVILLGTLIAILIADNKSSDELNLLGNLISQIGAGVSTMAAQQQNMQDQQKNCAVKSQIEDMERQLALLKKQLD